MQGDLLPTRAVLFLCLVHLLRHSGREGGRERSVAANERKRDKCARSTTRVSLHRRLADFGAQASVEGAHDCLQHKRTVSRLVSFRLGLFGAAGSTRGGLPVALAFTHSKASRRTLPRNSSAETAMSFALRSDHDPWAGKKREGALGRTRGRALPSAGGQLDVLGGLVWPSLFGPNSHVRVLDGEALLLRVILHELHGNLARRGERTPRGATRRTHASVSLSKTKVCPTPEEGSRERERERWRSGRAAGLGSRPWPRSPTDLPPGCAPAWHPLPPGLPAPSPPPPSPSPRCPAIRASSAAARENQAKSQADQLIRWGWATWSD